MSDAPSVHTVNGGRFPVSFSFYSGTAGVVIDPRAPDIVSVAVPLLKPPRDFPDGASRAGSVFDRPVEIISAERGEVRGLTLIKARFLDGMGEAPAVQEGA